MTGRRWLVTAVVGLACASGSEATIQESTLQVDSTQLMTDLRYLADDARRGRAAGSAGNEAAREYIAAAFQRIGLETFGTTYLIPFTFEPDSEAPTVSSGTNVVGFVRGGEAPNDFLVVTAHYDHLGVRDGQIFNGADDNASGTAALLALADYFSRHTPRHSIVFAATDAEELGLQGARALVTAPPVDRDRLRLNVNLDMVSRNDSVLYVAGTHHYPFLRAPLETVRDRAPVVLRFGHDRPDLPPGDDWTQSSDHGPFHNAQIPFVYFGVEDHPDYHRPTDDVEKIDPAFYLRSVRTILDAVLEIDANLESLLDSQEAP